MPMPQQSIGPLAIPINARTPVFGTPSDAPLSIPISDIRLSDTDLTPGAVPANMTAWVFPAGVMTGAKYVIFDGPVSYGQPKDIPGTFLLPPGFRLLVGSDKDSSYVRFNVG